MVPVLVELVEVTVLQVQQVEHIIILDGLTPMAIQDNLVVLVAQLCLEIVTLLGLQQAQDTAQ
jgi:hypothetical protein